MAKQASYDQLKRLAETVAPKTPPKLAEDVEEALEVLAYYCSNVVVVDSRYEKGGIEKALARIREELERAATLLCPNCREKT